MSLGKEKLEEELFAIVRGDALRMDILRAARGLALPDCWVGAGCIRSLVWDRLSGHEAPTPFDDVDVIYHDPACTDEAVEKEYEARLEQAMPGLNWSCKNQARMHVRYGRGVPYADTEDALRHWLETPTAVAVRLDENGALELCAPFGLEDMFAMRIAPTPFALAEKRENYLQRVREKPWTRQWPRLEVILPDAA